MRLTVAVVSLAATTLTSASVSVSASAFAFTAAFSPRTSNRRAVATCTAIFNTNVNSNNYNIGKDLSEFDFLLREQTATEQSQQNQQTTGSSSSSSYSRRGIALGGNNVDGKSVILASSFAGAPNQVQEQEEATSNQVDPDDPYANSLQDDSLQLNKIQSFQEQQISKPSIENRLKQMDLQDIIATIILPSIVAFAGLRWGFNKVSGKVKDTTVKTLEGFAKEMIYHDGDFDEMKLCVADYSKRLVWMGPAKRDAMLKKYLEVYAKKKTVSPKSISSLSYAFSLFKLSEEQAAAVLVSLCRQMGTDKISSAGKLLFLGSRILKSPQGKAALAPIKELIKSTYREEAVAETMMETSQQAMAEAAYRATILAGGKNQKKLTVGWEVLGLDREVAQRMWDEEAKEGFISEREAMYGGQKRKYDKKGNQLNDEGKLENPEDAIGDDEDDAASEGPVSNVHECSQCGFTLFVAQGREDKFFGANFKCPECGAAKDQFNARDDDDDNEE